MAPVVVLRDLTAADGAFQAEMLYTAAFWRPDGERPSIDLVLARRDASRYLADWGRNGDIGIVADRDGEPLGAAWCRLFTDDDHGDGFVDEGTPELAIAVREAHRRQGIARAMLGALHDRLRLAGITRIALSAESDNPARDLYRSLGYVDIAPNDPKDRMLLEL